MDRKEFINAKRVVIKLGTNILRNIDGNVSMPRIFSFIEIKSKDASNINWIA